MVEQVALRGVKVYLYNENRTILHNMFLSTRQAAAKLGIAKATTKS